MPETAAVRTMPPMSRVVVGETSARAAAPLAPAPDFGWTLLAVSGLVFALVSSADIALTWYPLAFGNAEWEFGTVTASLNGMPLLMIGLALMLGAAVARGQRWLIRTLSAIMVMLAIAVIAVALVYALTLPIALRAVSDAPLAALGLKKAIAKTSIQVMLYPLAFLWLAASGWRHSARQSRI